MPCLLGYVICGQSSFDGFLPNKTPLFSYFHLFLPIYWLLGGEGDFFKTNSRNTAKFSIDFIHFIGRFNSGVDSHMQDQFQRVFRNKVLINLCFIRHLNVFVKVVFSV